MVVSWLHSSLVHLVDSFLPCLCGKFLVCGSYNFFIWKLVGWKAFQLLGLVFCKMVGSSVYGMVSLFLCYHVGLWIDGIVALLHSGLVLGRLISWIVARLVD